LGRLSAQLRPTFRLESERPFEIRFSGLLVEWPEPKHHRLASPCPTSRRSLPSRGQREDDDEKAKPSEAETDPGQVGDEVAEDGWDEDAGGGEDD